MLGAEGWMVIGVGVVAGFLVLVQSWRKAVGRVAQLETEATRRAAKAEKLAVDLSKEARARRRQSEELASLRKRVEKTKRRKMKSADQPLGTSHRIRDHEAEVERVGLERDRVNSEREALETSVSDLESRLAESERALALATALQPDSQPVPVANSLDEAPGELASALEREKKLKDDLEIARQSELRTRKRMSNQEMLYASLRAELDVKKDRLRTQEEQLQRLQALKVAVID
jgi:chromosome segregation ATPase